MERLTKFDGKGWALKLDDPQNDAEARQQLMEKFKVACAKLAQCENMMEKYGIKGMEELESRIASDKEIESTLKFIQLQHEKQLKNITHETCERVKIAITGRCAYFVADKEMAQIDIDANILWDILDQIEKGDEK